MTATEMHDLLALAFNEIQKRSLYESGTQKEFTHVMYCRFCSYSQSHIAEHGHDETCLYGRLERACSPNSASGKHE